jgi:hypothetical protein
LTPEARRTMKSELGLVGTQTAPLRLQGRINTMKHLLTGVAVVAALAFSAPVWAQPASPSGGNSMGMPGPSPGGPGLTPYSTGAPPPPTPSASDTTSAMPPKHRQGDIGTLIEGVGFAADSPLEEEGFEPSVPGREREGPFGGMGTPAASR